MAGARRLARGQAPPSGTTRRLVVLLPPSEKKPPLWLLEAVAVRADCDKNHLKGVPKPGVAFYYAGDWSGWSFWW